MLRTPFAVYRQIKLAVTWYGQQHTFYRHEMNEYGEPVETGIQVQVIEGIYHSSSRAFIELINNEGASVKSKVSKGLLCCRDTEITVKQGDYVDIQGIRFYVIAVEPVMYSGDAIAYEISLEELAEGSES